MLKTLLNLFESGENCHAKPCIKRPCGNDSSEAEYYTSQSDRGHTESSAADTTRRTSRTESEPDLIDRAESAVDSMREDITSLVREGTREVHPFD